jgi:hypothetical protein
MNVPPLGNPGPAGDSAGRDLLNSALQRNPVIALAGALLTPVLRLVRFVRQGAGQRSATTAVEKLKLESYRSGPPAAHRCPDRPLGPVAGSTLDGAWEQSGGSVDAVSSYPGARPQRHWSPPEADPKRAYSVPAARPNQAYGRRRTTRRAATTPNA